MKDNRQTNQLLPQSDLEQHIINALQELRSATVAELMDALAAQGIRATGLTIYEHLKILKGKKVIIEPYGHADSTPRQPIFIYELAAKPAEEEHENIELQSPRLELDLSECIIRILEDSELVTSRDLVDELARIYGHRVETTQITQALKQLYQEGLLARPEPHVSGTAKHPVWIIQLKKTEGQTQSTAQTPSATPDQIQETILTFLGQREAATIRELQEALVRRLGVVVEHREIYEQLHTLMQQHMLAEPEKHPSHTTLAPVYIYRLRKPNLKQGPSTASNQMSVQLPLRNLTDGKEIERKVTSRDEPSTGDRSQPSPRKANEPVVVNQTSQLNAQPSSEVDLRAITVDSGIHYVFSSAEIDDHSFFTVRNQGNVANIILNSNHPMYARVMSLIEPSGNGKSVTPQGQEPFDAGETLRLLLIAWAEFEENQPSRKARERTEDTRSGWGRRLKDVLRRNGNQ